MRTEILRVEFINKTFSHEKVLNNVSFHIFEGETLALLGANGAGKTSLINIILGITPMDSGKLFFRGKPVEIKSPHDAKALGIYIAHDQNRVIDTLSIAENIFLGHEDSRFVSKKKLHREASSLMKQIALDRKPDTPVSELSLSEKALVQLAAVLVARPSLLIIDDSSFFGSDMGSKTLFRILRQLNAENTAVIFITHDVREAIQISNRIFVLKNGVSAGIYEKGAYTADQIITAIAGRDALSVHQAYSPSSEVVLRAACLTGNILQDVSFTVYKGEIFGITGLLDAGNTELLDILSGIQTKYCGKLYIDEREVVFSDPYEAMKCGIAYAPEDRNSYGFIPTMTVKENITLSSLKRVSTLGWIHKKDEQYFADRFLQLLEASQLDQKAYLKELSTGQQQQVQIARCLAPRPRIMLMDEPDKSMDIKSKEDILRAIRKLATEGTTLIIASADVDRLLHICDRLLILHNGRVRGEISGSEMTAHHVVAFTQNQTQRQEDPLHDKNHSR